MLKREPDPLIAAAIKVAKLRLALISAADQGDPEDLLRPAGAMLCSICGDMYRDHPMVPPDPEEGEPFLWHLCSGERVKL